MAQFLLQTLPLFYCVNMKKLILLSVVTLLSAGLLRAQDSTRDVFSPISKYFGSGDYESLSVWFADNLELEVLGAVNNCTRSQAKLIMKDFFTKYTPKSFEIIHKSGKYPMKYAVGVLNAGGEHFRIILYVKITAETSYIEQVKVERA